MERSRKRKARRSFATKFYSFIRKGLGKRHRNMIRVCLNCNKRFMSSWCGHRICDKCTEINKDVCSDE